MSIVSLLTNFARTAIFGNTGLKIKDADGSNTLTLSVGSNLTQERTLTLTTGDADRTLDISAGSVTITSYGASLCNDANATAALTTLGIPNVENTKLSTWAGTTNITTLGTITTGTWHGSPIDLSSYVTGNLSVNNLNSGTGASSTTFWRGDGTWDTLSSGDGLVSNSAGVFTGRTLTGTTGKITVTNGDGIAGNPSVTIDSGYIGQSTITTLGTITTGVWNGTVITPTYGGTNSAYVGFSGPSVSIKTFTLPNASCTILTTNAAVTEVQGGTNQTSYATGDTLYASGANTLSKLSGNTTTTRKFLRQTGTGGASQAPLWDTVTQTDVGLSAVENTALSTWAGTSSITTVGTITSGAWHSSTQISEIYGGTNQTSYTLGDTLYSSGSNTLSKLSGNTTSTRKFLRQTGTGTVSASPAWDTVTSSDVGLGSVENTALSTWVGTTNIVTVGAITTGSWAGTTIPEVHGGTNQTTYTQGDMLYASGSNTLAKLAKNTTATRYLANTGVSNNPAWDQINLANGVTGNLSVNNLNSGTSAGSTTFWRGDGTWATPSVVGVTGNGMVSNNGGTLTGRTITGTTNVIAVTNGDGISAAPNINIDAAYVGQSSITTLGTIATGTWQGTAIGISYGGLGASQTATNGFIPIGNGATFTSAALTASNYINIANASGSVTIKNTMVDVFAATYGAI